MFFPPPTGSVGAKSRLIRGRVGAGLPASRYRPRPEMR